MDEPSYPGAREAVIDGILNQVYYRGPGLVPTHLGISDSYAAAIWLAQNVRGGRVSWVAQGRAFTWDGISTAPGLPGSQSMNALFVGSPFFQLNTAVVRTRGFLREELARRFGWHLGGGEWFAAHNSLGGEGIDPVPERDQQITDSVLWQVYYRTVGAVGIHIGVSDAYGAAQWLAVNGRGGSVSWVIPGRLFVWLGIAVTPGEPNSPTMGALFAGSGLANLDTGIIRVAFWAPIIWQRIVSATSRIFGG